MFAYSCAKANGTHLGTCIDRFYFGSCCKIASNSDPDFVDPIVHNHLNKDDMSSMKTPYQRPSSGLPDFSVDTSSTMSLPVSVSTMSRPLSMPSMPSSNGDFFTTMFIKPGSTKPSSVHTTSSVSYDTVPITSRTPLVNVTFSQTYSTPTTHVTTSPIVYSTSVSTVFQTATHKPVSAFQTTAYSKPITKPTAKPGTKPKPSTGKPGPVKQKPSKPVSKPTLITQSSFSSYTSTSSPINSFVNKTTLHTFTNSAGLSSRPIYTTDSTVPTKTSPRPSTQGVPTPITLFTSSRRPTKPTKPSIYTTPPPPTSYVKIPVSTQSQSRPQTTISSSTFMSSTFDANTSVSFEQNLKINNTVEAESENENENEVTEKPSRPWTSSSSSSSMYSTRPWTMPSSSSTPSQPSSALVTWTTIDESPALIIPDRTKPTTGARPTSRPPVTKPGIIPTYSKPLASSTGRPASKPTSKPSSFKPGTLLQFDLRVA